MILKESFIKLSRSSQITFLFFIFLLQELIFIINYSDLYATMGYSKFSIFPFLVFLSTTISINLIFLIFLSSILLLFINFKKLVTVFIFLSEIIYSLFIYYDIKIYKTLGVHLYDNTVLAFLNKKSLENDILMKKNIFDFKTVFFLLSVLFLVIMMSLFIYWISKKASRVLNMPYILKNFIAYSLLIFLFAIFSHLRAYPILSVVPFYNILENDINLEWIKPNYPSKIAEKLKIVKRPNIVLILSESTRSDMQTKELMPNITDFIEKNENCIKSKHNFAGAHTTFPSLFSMIYGIYGYNNLFFNNQVTETEPVTLKFLKDNNYETVFLTASSLKASYGIKKITKFFDIFKFFKYDFNGKPDIDMVNWFKEYYASLRGSTGTLPIQKGSKPFFVIIFIRSPHYAYDYPKEFEKYKPIISLKDKNIALDSKYMSKKYKKELFNRYKNSILFTDSLFKKITNILSKEIKNENLILFYSGDHGEEFWERGKFGHFSTSFIKERVQTPFLFCLPKIKRKEINLTTSTDFFPTVIDYMIGGGWHIDEPVRASPPKMDFNKYFDGISLFNDKQLKNRFLIISTHSIAGTNSNMSLVNNDGKIDIKYSSRKISKLAKFTHGKMVDFDDREIKDEAKKKRILGDIKNFEGGYTRFIEMK